MMYVAVAVTRSGTVRGIDLDSVSESVWETRARAREWAAVVAKEHTEHVVIGVTECPLRAGNVVNRVYV